MAINQLLKRSDSQLLMRLSKSIHYKKPRQGYYFEKKTFQRVPHVGNITRMNHSHLSLKKLKSADEGKRPGFLVVQKQRFKNKSLQAWRTALSIRAFLNHNESKSADDSKRLIT